MGPSKWPAFRAAAIALSGAITYARRRPPRQSDPEPLRGLLDVAPRPPLATFSGHWHTSRVTRTDGALHVNTPSTFFA